MFPDSSIYSSYNWYKADMKNGIINPVIHSGMTSPLLMLRLILLYPVVNVKK
jgi:hypothetical protein